MWTVIHQFVLTWIIAHQIKETYQHLFLVWRLLYKYILFIVLWLFYKCKDSICNDHKMILGSHVKNVQTI